MGRGDPVGSGVATEGEADIARSTGGPEGPRYCTSTGEAVGGDGAASWFVGQGTRNRGAEDTS